MLFAIVDIETTGSYAHLCSITEVAVIVTDGMNEVSRWESLVKPDMQIPPFITALTHITNEMVADAPPFSEIAEELFSLLQDKIFIAHNVSFDYGFLKKAFAREGFSFNPKRGCTVRLSRKIIPEMKSYSLGKLTRQLGITHNNAHRAMGDTAATALLFAHLFRSDENGHIQKTLNQRSGETILPAHLPSEVFRKLPDRPGVYYFHDNKGKFIYIGKAKNLRKRVYSHFSGGTSSRKVHDFKKHIHNITFEETGSELLASLLEDREIKQYWPIYNRAQKDGHRAFGVYAYQDAREQTHIAIDKAKKHLPALASFPTLWEARTWLIRQVGQYELEPSLCGLPELYFSHTVADHEAGVEQMKEDIRGRSTSFIILERGRTQEEQAYVWVDNGNYKGFGFTDKENDLLDKSVLKADLQPQQETATVRSILTRVFQLESQKVHLLEEIEFDTYQVVNTSRL